MTETIKNNWLKHFITKLQKVSKVYIISPFINYTININGVCFDMIIFK